MYLYLFPWNKIKKIIKKINKVSQRIKILREGKQTRKTLTSDKKVRYMKSHANINVGIRNAIHIGPLSKFQAQSLPIQNNTLK